jgi:hypothetical protein
MAPRDNSYPADYFGRCAKRLQTVIRDTESRRHDALLGRTPTDCLNVSRALYSAGLSPKKCLVWCDRAVDYAQRFMQARWYSFGGYGDVEGWIQLLAAASLVQRAPEFVAAFRRCTFQDARVPGVAALLGQLACVITHDRDAMRRYRPQVITKLAPHWRPIPPLLKATLARDPKALGTCLEAYLRKTWAPQAIALKEASAKAKTPEFMGNWCYLAAATSCLVGTVPTLAHDLRDYLPSDLCLERLSSR